MRRKPLPPPPDELETVLEARAAVPLVASPEDDCCARLQKQLGLASRDVAATWLDFLRGLGLVREVTSGFARVRDEHDDTTLAGAFLEGVYGAREALDALEAADGPLDAADVADRTADRGPGWERRQHGPDWPAVWRERTVDLLDWLVLLGVAERADGGYQPAAD